MNTESDIRRHALEEAAVSVCGYCAESMPTRLPSGAWVHLLSKANGSNDCSAGKIWEMVEENKRKQFALRPEPPASPSAAPQPETHDFVPCEGLFCCDSEYQWECHFVLDEGNPEEGIHPTRCDKGVGAHPRAPGVPRPAAGGVEGAGGTVSERWHKIYPAKDSSPYLNKALQELTLAESALAAERQKHAEEIETLKELDRAKLPCGHGIGYGLTTDGGKTGICTRCELEKLKGAPWISVEDRLPETAHDVLILLGNALVERGYWYKVGAPIDGWYHRGSMVNNVTHWMPVPAPPSEEERA